MSLPTIFALSPFGGESFLEELITPPSEGFPVSRNTGNIRGGFDGHIYVGGKGAAAPADPVVPWDVDDFVEMGWLTDDGIVNARSRDINEVMAMGVTTAPVWSRVTSQESTLAVTFMETRAEVLAVFFGQRTTDMTSTAAVTGGSPVPQFTTLIEQATTQPAEYALGIDLVDGDYLYRRFYPRVQVTETGDLSFVTTDPLGYPVTFKAMIGADGTVAKHMWANLALPAAAFPPVIA